MSKSLSRVAAPLMTLALALALSACSGATDDESPVPDPTQTAAADPALAAQEAALETYVDASQASIPAIMEECGTACSEIHISAVQPGTVEYAYAYTESLDPDAAAAYFDENVPVLQDACDTQLFPEMAGYGITIDPKVRYTYYNADGSLIWSHDFSRS